MNLLKSKTFWTGIASIAIGIGFAIDGNTEEGIRLILAGMACIGFRDFFRKVM